MLIDFRLYFITTYNYKNYHKDYFCITFGSGLMYNKIIKFRNSCVCVLGFITLLHRKEVPNLIGN